MDVSVWEPHSLPKVSFLGPSQLHVAAVSFQEQPSLASQPGRLFLRGLPCVAEPESTSREPLAPLCVLTLSGFLPISACLFNTDSLAFAF